MDLILPTTPCLKLKGNNLVSDDSARKALAQFHVFFILEGL